MVWPANCPPAIGPKASVMDPEEASPTRLTGDPIKKDSFESVVTPASVTTSPLTEPVTLQSLCAPPDPKCLPLPSREDASSPCASAFNLNVTSEPSGRVPLRCSLLSSTSTAGDVGIAHFLSWRQAESTSVRDSPTMLGAQRRRSRGTNTVNLTARASEAEGARARGER